MATPLPYFILQHIKEHPHHTARQIATALGSPYPSVTRLLAVMTARGIVTRSRDYHSWRYTIRRTHGATV